MPRESKLETDELAEELSTKQNAALTEGNAQCDHIKEQVCNEGASTSEVPHPITQKKDEKTYGDQYDGSVTIKKSFQWHESCSESSVSILLLAFYTVN